MKHRTRLHALWIAALFAWAPFAFAAAAASRTIRATHAIELEDPRGDVGPISVGTADKMVEVPGFDMVHLSIRSDGQRITFAATLTQPPGASAGEAVDFHVDTDANARTGMDLPALGLRGMEYSLHLDSCVNFDDHLGPSCAVSRKAHATANWGAVVVERYNGTNSFQKEKVVDDGDFVRGKASVKTPVAGAVLQGSVDYADLKVKPGQTIRIVAAEYTKRKAGSRNIPEFCPEILLTLK